MSEILGYKCIVSVLGTSTSSAGDIVVPARAISDNGDGTSTLQIDDPQHRHLDPAKTVTVKKNGTLVKYLSIDYLLGKIVISASIGPSDTFTVSFHYVAGSKILGATGASIDMSTEIVDTTTMDKAQANGGFKTKAYGLHDVTATLDGLHLINATLWDSFLARKKFLLDFEIPGDGVKELIKGWFIVESDNSSFDQSNLGTESISFTLAGDPKANLSWSIV